MKKLLDFAGMRSQTCAFSNSSANGIEGMTMNKFLNLGRNEAVPKKETSLHSPRFGYWKDLEAIVVEEFGMVGAHFLNALNEKAYEMHNVSRHKARL